VSPTPALRGGHLTSFWRRSPVCGSLPISERVRFSVGHLGHRLGPVSGTEEGFAMERTSQQLVLMVDLLKHQDTITWTAFEVSFAGEPMPLPEVHRAQSWT
jgi:hypothetical protein